MSIRKLKLVRELIIPVGELFELTDEGNYKSPTLLVDKGVFGERQLEEVKTYILLKDTVRTKAGVKFHLSNEYYRHENIGEFGLGCGYEGFSIKEVEESPEWFKEVKQ